MKTEQYIIRLLQAAAITLTLVAVCQELEKPEKERKWHGTVAGFIPYEFRMPTVEKFREAYWNPYETRIFTPEVFGVGWAINFYALLEKLRIMGQGDGSEEDFLMPGPLMKEVLTHGMVAEQT
ncbi:MAG: hypothetical protein V3R92_00410 [Dehalococcoidales bacterium]